MEFLVEFDVNVPDGAARSEVEERQSSEAAGAAKLVDEGHLIRIWKPPVAPGEAKALGLYHADSQTQLDGLLGALPAGGLDARHRHGAPAPPQRPGERPA